jgi:DNA repair exonuclease SbcCD ATPase subunit
MMIALEPNEHDYYEELGALAALGQVSEREFVELESHLKVCPACRSTQADYVNLTHHKLPLALEGERKWSRRPRGLRNFLSRNRKLENRFLVRAQQDGWRFSEAFQPAPSFRNRFEMLTASLSYKQGVAIFLILSLALISVLGYRLHVSNTRNATLYREISKLGSQNADLQQQLKEIVKPDDLNPVPSALLNSKTELLREDSVAGDALAGELSRAREEHEIALMRIKTLESELQGASIETQTLRTQIETGKSKGSELEGKLRETEASLGQMNEEIQKLRSAHARTADQTASQVARVNELSEKLKAQSETLDRERSLLAAGRDIRDLMGARNLHILDVFDVDGKGKSNQTFGRVFYTEGKSLIFYAFDLGDKKRSFAKASFQAWGYQASKERSFESLGIFYVDDKNQNRWVLKFDNPEVLAQIDSVFVTIEPSGGSRKPTGQKLLYAYLNTRPNHP